MHPPNSVYLSAPSIVLPSSDVEEHVAASQIPHMSALGRLRYLRDSHTAVLSAYPMTRGFKIISYDGAVTEYSVSVLHPS